VLEALADFPEARLALAEALISNRASNALPVARNDAVRLSMIDARLAGPYSKLVVGGISGVPPEWRKASARCSYRPI
jgi:hypothetical protein